MDKLTDTRFEHVMLDIETLGQGARAPVVQIGAVMFEPKTGEIGPGMQVPVAADFKRFEPDAGTVEWWMRQSQEARESVFVRDADSVEDAAARVVAFFGHPFLASEGVKVWAKPPSFDLVILENMMRVAGVRRMPWSYRAPRCLRTLMELADVSREEEARAEVPHSALSDAEAQAKTAAICWERLGLGGAASAQQSVEG